MKTDPHQTCVAATSPGFESPGAETFKGLSDWSARHPVLVIVLVSLIAVIANCYPVVFCGKSFVSPTDGMPMVYDWWPPLPGMDNASPPRSYGSDTAALLIWGIPAGFVQSQSLLDHGTLPLWNRYSHAGDTLIGQGISMFGDPLQMIVIVGRGAAGAWDVKFLVAKFLFCVGFGLLVLRMFGSTRLALLSAVLAAWCGAFFYIAIHPGFFVLCYAPWILLSAMRFLDVREPGTLRWGLVWLLVNFGCFNAGHLEAAVLLIGGLNLVALINALLVHRGMAGAMVVAGRMAAGTLLFLGLTSPFWMSFLGALQGAYTVHEEVRVVQLPFAGLLGAFDDLFFRLPLKDDSYRAIAPGTSLLVAMGCALSVMGWKRFKGEPLFWINSVATAFWAGCIFGVIPSVLIELVPMVNRIGHAYRDFSYLLVFHSMVQCVFGFRALAMETSFKSALMGWFGAATMVAAMILLYFLGINHRPVPALYFACVIAGAAGAPLLFAFLNRQRRAITVAGWAGIILLGFLPHMRFGHYTFGNPDLLRVAGPRVELNAPSDSIQFVKSDGSEPFRVVGVRRILFGDSFAVYGLEDIRSCAPLSNPELIRLMAAFPGMNFSDDWVIEVANPVAAQPLLNLFNVKYLLTPPGLVLQEGLDFRVAHRGDLAVLENQQVWPRAFFTDKVRSVSSNDEFIGHLRSNGTKPFVALTPEEISRHAGIRELESNGEAVVVPATNCQLQPNSTSFEVRAPTAGVICLSEGQARDFTVRVNNSPRPVLTVNRVFKGVFVEEAGDYRVEFVYRPRHWQTACVLFWISVSAIVVIAIVTFARRGVRARMKPSERAPA